MLGQADQPNQLDFQDASGNIQAVYESAQGYAVEVAVPGFNGEIRMMVGITPNGEILGISVISHTETAGLGAVAGADNAKGQAFREQFAGLTGKVSLQKDGGQVDGLSGATITSRAIADGVNAALECVNTLEKEGVA